MNTLMRASRESLQGVGRSKSGGTSGSSSLRLVTLGREGGGVGADTRREGEETCSRVDVVVAEPELTLLLLADS